MSTVPSQNEPVWPPKSPHQALLSSPSGRRKWQQRQRDQLSPSPSPVKRFGTPRPGSRASQLLADGLDDNMDEDEDEDEETLQLKLQAIEARLKLKKLQSAKAKQTVDSDGDDNSRKGASSSYGTREPARRPATRPAAPARSQSDIQVPVSPTRDRRAPRNPTSPARVLLGIDKGLRAQDVSLKRPVVPKANAAAPRPGLGARSDRPNSYSGLDSASGRNSSFDRPKSFSERLAESRVKENEKQAKDERIQAARTGGFGINTAARAIGNQEPRSSSQQSDGRGSQSFERRAAPGLREAAQKRPPTSVNNSFSSTSSSSRPSSRQLPSSQSSGPPSSQRHRKTSSFSGVPDPIPDDSASFEPFSGLHLSKRLLSHSIVTRALEQKELFPLPRLLATVKGPHYDPPDVESDFVVLGVVASKSTPRNAKTNHKASAGPDDDDKPNSSKFMVLHLTDFKWEIDLFLFDTAFTSFWKLTPGTLVAILNPGIMPPRDKATGQFSLKLGSSEDMLLEIGSSRDLGFCKSIKKDGQECSSWIDKRKTEFCEFHISLQVEKSKRGRMEVNTMTGFGTGPPKKRPESSNRHYDTYLHETAYIVPNHISGRSTADRLDHDGDAFDRGMSRGELHRKRLTERERERELAEKLGRIGGKAGGEYMRVKGSNNSGTASSSTKTANSTTGNGTGHTRKTHSRSNSAAEGRNTPAPVPAPAPAPVRGTMDEPFRRHTDALEPPDAASLGLLGKRASDVTLSPIKRKRHNATTASGTGGKAASSGSFTAEPMGWGGAGNKDFLLSPSKKVVGNRRIDEMLRKDREKAKAKDDGKCSPKKKARLMIEGKGIREPGRESMGSVAVPTKVLTSDDDDDGLEII